MCVFVAASKLKAADVVLRTFEYAAVYCRMSGLTNLKLSSRPSGHLTNAVLASCLHRLQELRLDSLCVSKKWAEDFFCSATRLTLLDLDECQLWGVPNEQLPASESLR